MEVQEIIDILTAFKAGKTIQMECDYVNGEGKMYSKWTDVESFESIIRNIPFANSMRVKPEPKYRPYKNADEFVKASQEHKDLLRAKSVSHPVDTKYMRPCNITDDCVWGVNGNESMYDYRMLLNMFVWNDDGSPCGVTEEE